MTGAAQRRYMRSCFRHTLIGRGWQVASAKKLRRKLPTKIRSDIFSSSLDAPTLVPCSAVAAK